MDDGSGAARCGDGGQRPRCGAQRRTAGTDKGRCDGRCARARTEDGRWKRREGSLLQRLREGERKQEHSSGEKRHYLYKVPSPCPATLPPSGPPENRPDSTSRPPLLLIPAAPCAISRAEFSPSPRAVCLAQSPLDPSSFPSAESVSRTYRSGAAAPRCCVRPTLSAVEWLVTTPP